MSPLFDLRNTATVSKTKYLALLSAGVLTLGLAGCSSNAPEEPAPTEAEVTQTEAMEQDDDADDSADDSNVVPFADTEAGLEAIKAVELESNGIVVEVDREDDHKRWEITALVGDEEIEYHVNAEGEVTEHERDDADDDDKRYAPDALPIVEAIGMAMAEVPDGYLDEVSLDEDDGVVAWEIDFDDDKANDLTEIVLEYKSGDIIERDDDDDNDD